MNEYKELENGYICKFKWDKNCFVQGDIGGLVTSKKGNYRTAFFEAFPKNPDTFIRGEGKTIEEAEEKAWSKLVKYRKCKNHEFERRNYTNGAGFCKHCGLFKSNVFEPSTKCNICGKSTNWVTDRDGNYYCKEHQYDMGIEKMYDMFRHDYVRNIFESNIRTLEDVSYLKGLKEIDDIYDCKFFLSNMDFTEDLLKSKEYLEEKGDKFIWFLNSIFYIYEFTNKYTGKIKYLNSKIEETKDNFNNDKYIIIKFSIDDKICYMIYRLDENKTEEMINRLKSIG